MKSVVILLALSSFNFIVQEASSASPRLIDPSRGSYGTSVTTPYKPPKKQGYYDGNDNGATFFPGNAMMLFQLRAAIQSSLHKIDDDKESLKRIKTEIKLLEGLADVLFSFYRDAVEGLMTNCIYYEDVPSTLPPPIKIGNKCYSISDTSPDAVSDEDYDDARQICLAHGGDLASPYLLAGGTFGSDLAEALEEALEDGVITDDGGAANYWIDGSDEPLGGSITTSSDFIIPNNLPRYYGVSTFPYIVPQVIPSDSSLTLVGPLQAIEHDWYIAPIDEDTELPFICEFNTAIDLSTFSSILAEKFRSNKSPLIQNFLRKVRLIQKRISEMNASLRDAASPNITQIIIDAVFKETQNTKITENVEYKTKVEAIKSDQVTKTSEVVIENKKLVDRPLAVVKKETILETKKDETLETEKDKTLEAKKDKPLETMKDKPLEIKKDKPIEAENENKKDKPLDTNKDKPIEVENDKPLEIKKDKPIETENENKKDKPLDTNKDKPVDAENDKSLETNKGKPIEAEKVKPFETKKDGPIETKKDKPLETKRVLKVENSKTEEEIPKRRSEIIPNKEMVSEDDKKVYEKKISLEDILGQLEQLEF